MKGEEGWLVAMRRVVDSMASSLCGESLDGVDDLDLLVDDIAFQVVGMIDCTQKYKQTIAVE